MGQDNELYPDEIARQSKLLDDWSKVGGVMDRYDHERGVPWVDDYESPCTPEDDAVARRLKREIGSLTRENDDLAERLETMYRLADNVIKQAECHGTFSLLGSPAMRDLITGLREERERRRKE